MNLLILADDLTGAADSAARSHNAGLSSTIFLEPPKPPFPSETIAFTSDSRHLPADQAAQRVERIITNISPPPDTTWYKKIDSTLRGNIGSELIAMQHAIAQFQNSASSQIVICPSFPDQGRCLQDGKLITTQGGTQTDLCALLQTQADQSIAHFSLHETNSVGHLSHSLSHYQNSPKQLIVIDAMTNAHLHTIVAATRRALPNALFCGSAGLVDALVQNMLKNSSATDPHAPTTAPIHLAARPSRTLIVVGSGSAMAQAQVNRLRDQPNIQSIELDPDSPTKVVANRNKAHHLIHLPPPPQDAQLDGPAARILAETLATAAINFMQQIGSVQLILVGGDTTVHALCGLGINKLDVIQELLPGMPLTKGISATQQEQYVTLKAGNHGDENTLVELIQS